MIKLKFIIILTTILILIFSIINYQTYAADPLSEFMGIMKENPAEGLNQLAQNPITDTTTTQMSGYGQIGEVTPASTGSLSSGVNLQNIIGSTRVAIMGGRIVGGMIVSSVNDHALPAFNPLTGDVIVYNMDLGDTVLIDYSIEPAYNAKMSEGVKAEIQSKNKVRFTAYGKDSVLKIKPTEEPSYEFNNGLLEYESSNVLEQVNTSKVNDANVDKDYNYGFKCLTLAADANYNYDDKVKPERSFEIKNLDKQDYKVCIKKTIYDDYQLVNQRYGLIDLVKDSLKLKSKVAYSRKSNPVYESFDGLNDAEIETSLGVTKLLISNKAPSSEMITKTYVGNHVLTEKLNGRSITRYHEFSKTKHPELVSIYSTKFKTEQPDITVKDNMLVQDGKNRFSAITQENKDCLEQLGSLFDYKEEETFYDKC
jgi:hypothetical protein